MSDKLSIEERVNIALAVGRYLRAAERFEQASKDFSEACDDVRKFLEPEDDGRLVVKHDYKSYLVTHGRGSFDISPIEIL
jgi:hypothetical protein